MPALADTALPAFAQHDADGIARAIEDDGLAFVPRLLDRELVAETCRRIDALQHLPGDGVGRGTAVDHYKCVFNRDPFWLRFIDPPGIVDAVERLMGPECHIIGMSAWRTPPGGSWDDGSKLHLDQIFIPMDEELLVSGRVRLPVFIATLHYYLSDIDRDLCPTWVLPGTHKAGRPPGGTAVAAGHASTVAGAERVWRGREAFPVLCSAGDALLFRSELWHSGSQNVTRDRWRYLLQVHYAQRGIAQRFPPYIEFRHDPAVMAAASPRQQRMMGKHRISAYG